VLFRSREKKKDEPYIKGILEEYYNIDTNPVIAADPEDNEEYPF
jgi:hypothetical protein